MNTDRPSQISQLLLSIDMEDDGYGVVPDESKLGRTVMPIAGIREGELSLLGTCFAIGPNGFLLTAKHVVQDSIDALETTRAGLQDLCVLYENADLAPPHPGWLVGGPLPVGKVCPHPSSDLAVLQVALPKYGPGHLGLSPVKTGIRAPAVGQSCFALGFPRMRIEALDDGSYVYERPLTASRGEVTEVYLAGRGASMPFPCFGTTAGADSGMSGGPMWTGDGRLVGVVSSSFSPETRVSHAALTSPLGDIVVPMRDRGSPRQVTVRDLANCGGILWGDD